MLPLLLRARAVGDVHAHVHVNVPRMSLSTCMRTFLQMRMHMCMRMCRNVRMRMCMCRHVRVRACAHAHVRSADVHACVACRMRMCACAYAARCMCACVCAEMCTYVCACAEMCACIFLRACVRQGLTHTCKCKLVDLCPQDHPPHCLAFKKNPFPGKHLLILSKTHRSPW